MVFILVYNKNLRKRVLSLPVYTFDGLDLVPTVLKTSGVFIIHKKVFYVIELGVSRPHHLSDLF